MTRTSRPTSRTLLLLAGSGLAITLAGCKVDNRPLIGRDNPQFADAGLPQPGLPNAQSYGGPAYGAQPYGAQPYAASYLPPAQAYPYAERAYRYDRAFYDTPPNYGFAYGDEQPWVWEAADDSRMFAEPYGDDYRFYYYQRGADRPYFVRDDRYGYAYGDNGALVALFDAAGALISANDYGRYAPQARQYWSRGSDLYASYGRGQRFAVDRTVWSQRAPRIARSEQPWMSAPDRQPQWRDWRSAAGAGALQRYDVRRSDRGQPGVAIAQHNWDDRQAQVQDRGDNGRHLGWNQGRHNPHALAFNGPQPAPQSFQAHGDDRGPAFARGAEDHGRNTAFRGPQPQQQQAQAQNGGWHEGEDHNKHEQRQAQNGGGQDHGGGHGEHDKGQGHGQGEQKHDGGDHGHHHGD